MPPKLQRQPIDVVEIDSSDDDNDVSIVPSSNNPSSSIAGSKSKPPPHTAVEVHHSPALDSQGVECRSFWKAGAYQIGPVAKLANTQGELEHARVHPKFLHSNATSHKWAFGAIAELMDNAVDEVHNGATFLKVDKLDIMKDNSPALLFQDDGGGMDPDSLRKCMSLGYSSKKSNKTIGQYGNGFKTSTMRLGADAIVFSRTSHASKATQSVGLLSYTFLRKTGQDDVIVPMIDFDISGHWVEPIIYGSQDDWSSNLKTILEWSPFTSKDELMQQFEDIGSHGTKVIIYNLWLNDEGIYELNFDDDDEDIRLRDEANHGGEKKVHKKVVEIRSHISYRIRYSLRAYASILYLRKFTNFTIILRGKPVQQYNIADDLNYSKKVTYRPQLGMTSQEVTVETTIGFIKEAPEIPLCGYNVYHKNRLIRPFWKVTPEGNSKGNGAVGVLEANFIEPAHDKQDFERSPLFVRLEAKLKQILMEYWINHCHLVGYQSLAETQQKQAAKSRRQLPTNQCDTGVSVNGQENIHLDQPLNERLPDISHMSNAQLGCTGQSNFPWPHDDVISENVIPVEQICEENIQLFLRCEDLRQKENEQMQMVAELEKELEQARRKCAQLSAHLETKKKQKTVTH